MSGPKTAVVTYPPAAAVSGLAVSGVVVAAMALREVYRMTQETRQVEDAAKARDAEREAAELRLVEAAATRRIEVRTNAEAVAGQLLQQRETVLQLLPDLAAGLPALPPTPDDGASAELWQAYLNACEAAQTMLGQLLRQSSADSLATADRHQRHDLAELPGLDLTLRAYLLERQRNPALSALESAFFAETVARILDRLDRTLVVALPAGIASLARDIVLAPDRERAEALASELRLRVQNANTLAQEEKTRAEHEAAAFVLEASLRDLGYAVDDIAETVFVDGGVVHFQKRGWGEYFVRLRIDAARHSANFNVVRSGDPAAAASEPRRADQLAEDRWCAELPRLFETLRARGLKLDLQRHIAAGQLPVQVVDPASLPTVAREEAAELRQPAARARPIN